MNIEEAKQLILSQSISDEVGLWEIAKILKEEVGILGSERLKAETLEIVGFLINSGIQVCYSPYQRGNEFVPWDASLTKEALDKVAMIWDELSGDIGIHNTPWFKKIT